MTVALIIGVMVGVYRAMTVGRDAARNVRPRDGRFMNIIAVCIAVAVAIIYGRTRV
jgi:uncharacterized membrane protein